MGVPGSSGAMGTGRGSGSSEVSGSSYGPTSSGSGGSSNLPMPETLVSRVKQEDDEDRKIEKCTRKVLRTLAKKDSTDSSDHPKTMMGRVKAKLFGGKKRHRDDE